MAGRVVNFCEHKTPAGLRVLVEENPDGRSAAAGFFVATGARNEDPALAGVSHFLEHMAFKSSKKRSAQEISLALDRIGAKANAYTSWERTVYYAQVLPEFTRTLIESLAEMIDPALLLEDFTTEKKVILEEIEMYNDRPEFLLFDALMEARFSGHPLGIRVLGSRDSIKALTHEQMRGYHARRYCTGNIVLAVSGRVDAPEIFAIADALSLPAAPPSAGPTGSATGTGDRRIVREADQREHFIAAWPGPRNREIRERMTAGILAVLLGDAEGSRLSWALTHPGIAESVEAGPLPFHDEGLFYGGFTATPENFAEARRIFDAEFARLKDGIRDDELERARTKSATRAVLSSESAMGRMSSLGGDCLDGLGYFSLKDELDLILSIRKDEVVAFGEKLGAPIVTTAIGPMAQ